jgi:MscS family membrane protein
MIDVAAHWFELRLADRGDTTAATIVPVGRRIAKVFLLAIALLAGLQNLGFNVVSIIAGLGVVGIAVALSAQKTFEHFFGTIELLVDQPVKRGDFCRYGDKIGVVEDIGLRSTRVRTLDRTIVTVPNSEFASLQIENFGPRDRIRFNTVLGLRYETSADQLRHVLIELKRLLVEHPKVSLDPARVRLVAFGAFSLDVEIYAYVLTSDWNEFLAVREDLMLQIIDIVAASGTGFAFPSQTLYVAPDTGLDAERTRAAESAVKDWKQQHELWLPDFPEERIRELEDSRSYPSEGSALAPARPGRGAPET